MGKRTQSVAETRQRIVEAAVELHGSLGAATSIAAIAEVAGVTRLTVYRHFPDADSLFAACSAHWMSEQVLPRPELWATVADPLERLGAALSDLYRFYRAGAQMLSVMVRDEEHLPAAMREQDAARTLEMRELVVSAFRLRGARQRRLRAVVGHAMEFETWRSMCSKQGLREAEAVDLLVAMAGAIAAEPVRRGRVR